MGRKALGILTRRAALGLLAAPALAGRALAQTLAQSHWPDRPVRAVVPFAPGGPADVVARLLADPVAAALGQPLVIENRAGAGGNIGMQAAAQAPRDGLTLLVTAAGPIVINPALYPNPGYDPVRDFTPVSRLATGPLLVVCNPRLPYRNVGDVIADARRRPGEINFATGGNGTVPHLATELFMRQAGIRMTHVPFRATPQATQAVMAGDAAVFFDSPTSLSLARDGRLRALAVTALKRFSLTPGVPSMPESGGPNTAVEAWYAVLAPAGVPADRVARIGAAFTAAARRPDVVERFASLGFTPVNEEPARFAALIAEESARWREVVRSAAIRIE